MRDIVAPIFAVPVVCPEAMLKLPEYTLIGELNSTQYMLVFTCLESASNLAAVNVVPLIDRSISVDSWLSMVPPSVGTYLVANGTTCEVFVASVNVAVFEVAEVDRSIASSSTDTTIPSRVSVNVS